jgi:rhodanese-related sulfurtransferase
LRLAHWTKVLYAKSPRSGKTSGMKTMDCVTLETLIANHEPVNLIDIRSKNEFREMHIPGARSLPFAELVSPKGFLRYRPTVEQVYIVSDDRARASLASGILRASGYKNAMVVEGGIKNWIAQGFPVLRRRIPLECQYILRVTVALFGIAGMALALAKFLFLSAILICAGAFLFQAGLLMRSPADESRKFSVPKSGPEQWRGITRTRPAHAC